MPYQPTTGDRVRLGGFDGPRAIILEFKRKADGRPYFKAKRENSGELVWPDHAVADSQGAYVRTCTDCEIDFRTDTVMTVLCPNCDRRQAQRGGADTRRTTGARYWQGR